MSPFVTLQAAGFYHALSGKIIGVFKEQVRNPRFFTLPLATRPAFKTPFADLMPLSSWESQSYQVFRQTLPALSACHPLCSVHSLHSLGHHFVPSDHPAVVVSRRDDGNATREINSVSYLFPYTKNWVYGSYCFIMLTKNKNGFDSLRYFPSPFWKRNYPVPMFSPLYSTKFLKRWVSVGLRVWGL